MKTSTRRRGVIWAVVAALATVGSVAAPSNVTAHNGNGGFEESPVGFFYGAFGQNPELALLAGGTIEEFCLDNPADPFNGQPGTGLIKFAERPDGTLVVKGKAAALPIHLYEHQGEISPPGIGGICADFFDGDPTTVVPQPVASGTAKLKIRDVIAGDTVDVFNSVRGRVIAPDGTVYGVFASADLVVENGVPQGDPADFVTLEVREIGG